MSSNALTVEPVSSDIKISVTNVRQAQEAIWELMAQTMQPGEDYGITPGSKKPSLYKPGSEKILSMFKLAVDVLVEDVPVPTSDIGHRYTEYRVRVYVTVKEMTSGRFIGKGLGECSSYEEKYLWRRAVSEKEFNHYRNLHQDLVRIDFTSYWDKDERKRVEYETMQIRVPTADRMNTVIKMAKKRGQIDATLTATAASAIFTQDMEDIKKELLEYAMEEEDKDIDQTPEAERKKQGPPKRPVRKSAEKKQETTASAKEETAKPETQQEEKKDTPRERDKDCISIQQEKMLWGISRMVKLSTDEVKAKLKAEYKDKHGKPLEHSYDMPRRDFNRYLDSVDPEFKHHDRS